MVEKSGAINDQYWGIGSEGDIYLPCLETIFNDCSDVPQYLLTSEKNKGWRRGPSHEHVTSVMLICPWTMLVENDDFG